MNYQGKKCVVLGLGRSGFAAARLLAREGAIVSVLDSGAGEAVEKRATLLRAENITVCLGAPAEKDPALYDLAILSPGIEVTTPLVKNVTEKGIPLLGELELAYSCVSLPIVAITGSNGKTTTTELVTKMLQGAGLRAIACGNIGLPFSEAILASDLLDVFVVEVSSFQLEGIEYFRPNVAVWLNLSPNHLDRYHSMEEYRAAKERIFKNQEAEDVAVIPVSLDRTRAAIKAHCITFSTATSEGDFSFHDGVIFYQKKPILALQETRLRGLHNVENLMAAFAVGVGLNCPLPPMAEAIKEYVPPAHRCEMVFQKENVIWINDSKSTTLDAMEKAITSIEEERPIILIAGGKNKGSSFAPLLPLVEKRVKMAFLLGEMKEVIALEWKSIPCQRVGTLEEAVALAADAALPGETVLLSPGTSSYDMFSNYEERGDCFKNAIHRYYQYL